MIINGSKVKVLPAPKNADVEDDTYLTRYAGKVGVVKETVGECFAVELQGVERIAYFYGHELQKI